MTKGKYGIVLGFYAALGFILAVFGQTLLCGLLLGFVVVTEKNDWLTKQVLQAFFLVLFLSAISYLLGFFYVFDNIPLLSKAITIFTDVISRAVDLLVLIFSVIGIVKVIKEQEANIPLLSPLASRVLGYVEQKVYTQMPPQNFQNPQ